MRRELLSSSRFNNGFNVPGNPLDAPDGSMGEGSRNQIYIGTGWVPFKGLAPQAGNSGSRLMRQIGGSWGGLKDYVSGVTIQGKGSFFEDIGRSRWFIGSGVPSVEGVDMTGITASTILQVSIAVAGAYSAGTTFSAGLPIPSTPGVGIAASPGLGYTGKINGPVSVKISRGRSTTGARSVSSTTSAVISPVNKTIRITFPSASTGQTHWIVFVTQQGYGGVGLHHRLSYLGSLDILESAVAAGVVDGITRSLEFDFQDGDLIPEVAYIDDYTPPAATHAVRLQNVMCVLGAYGDSSAAVSSTSPGTAGAVSLPNFYESYKPRHLIYFPEAIVDVMARPSDEYAYVGHRNSVTALQYVGVRDGPAVSVTMVWPDIGIKFPHNWCQVHGLLYVMSATNGLVRMKSNGSVDYDFADPVRAYMSNWTQDNTSVGWHPNTLNLVVFNKDTKEALSYSLQKGRWSPPAYFADAGVTGGALSCVNTVGRLMVTVDDGVTHRAHAWHEGATSMPIASFTNWKESLRPVSIMELDVGFETDSATNPLIISVHRNMRKTYVRDTSTTNLSNVIGSASAGFKTNHTGDMVCVFGANIGGAGINYLIGRMTFQNALLFLLTNPTTGAPLLAQATLTNAYLIIATQIFVYFFSDPGKQHTPPLTDVLVDEAQSHCIGLSLITQATAGQILSVNALGTGQGVPTALAS